jgi:proteasome lid subunit RPN8/RPN11
VWLLRRRIETCGELSRVEANWQYALMREEYFGDVLGFLHTHPPGASTRPSARDVRTMHAWCAALGKPLVCVIQCENQTQSTLFADDESQGETLGRTILFAHEIVVIENDEHERISS